MGYCQKVIFMSSTVPFIEFRRAVQIMINENEFSDDIDPIIYAIKERQHREVSYRIQTAMESICSKGDQNKRYCAARVFMRSDILNPSDYHYMLNEINSGAKLMLLRSFLDIPLTEDDWTPDFKMHLRSFLDNLLPTEIEPHRHGFSILSHNEFSARLSRVYDDLGRASFVFKTLSALISSEDNGYTEIRCKSIIKNLNYIMLKHPNKIEDFLYEESMVSNDGTFVFSSKRGQVNMLNELLLAKAEFHKMDSKVLTEIDSSLVKKVEGLLSDRLSSSLKQMIEMLSGGVTSALEGFGNRNTKSGGREVSIGITEFAQLLSESSVDDRMKKEIGTLMVTKLCNGSVKTMDSQNLKAFFSMVKDMVDWEDAVSTMKEAGRRVLINHMSDTHHYRDFLSQSERGETLRSDMGM